MGECVQGAPKEYLAQVAQVQSLAASGLKDGGGLNSDQIQVQASAHGLRSCHL